jgi:hypothetical protein
MRNVPLAASSTMSCDTSIEKILVAADRSDGSIARQMQRFPELITAAHKLASAICFMDRRWTRMYGGGGSGLANGQRYREYRWVGVDQPMDPVLLDQFVPVVEVGRASPKRLEHWAFSRKREALHSC